MPKMTTRPTKTERPPMSDEPETQESAPTPAPAAEAIAKADHPDLPTPPVSEEIVADLKAEAAESGVSQAQAGLKEEPKAAAKPAPVPLDKPTTGTSAKPAARKPAARKGGLAGSLFTPLEEVEEFYNVLYWGREGSSKTTAMARAANAGRLLVINAEGGLKRRALARQGVNLENISVYPKPGEPITYEGLDAVYREVKADLEADPDSWYAVGFDSATEIVQAMVGDVSDDRLDKARGRGANIDIFDQFTTDRNDYGVMAKQFRDIIRKFRDLQCHVIVTALERRDVDEDTAKVMYGPAVSPALQIDLLGYMDVVLYCRAADEENDYFRAATKKAGKFRSKDRIGSVPQVLVNPTFDRLLGYVEETLDETTDPVQSIIQEQAAARAAAEAAKEERRAAVKSRVTGSKPETAAAKRAREKREAEAAEATAE
jgi:hypothetical protein